MNRVFGLLISGLAVGVGLCGVIWPTLDRHSLEDQYTPWKARIAGFVLLLLEIAGLVAILSDKGGAVDFFRV